MGRGPLSGRVAAFLVDTSVCGISSAFAGLSPTPRHVPTWSSAVRHSECKHPACDLHALGTPPAFVLSQDQTLRYVGWNATAVASAPTESTRVTCASSRFSCEGTSGRGQVPRANKKPGVSARQRRRTPGDVSGHSASACREEKDVPEYLSCCVYAVRRETTAVTTRRSIARAQDDVKSVCQAHSPVRGARPPSPAVPRGLLYHPRTLVKRS